MGCVYFSNISGLHGGAESLLTVTNLLIVLGLRKGIREAQEQSSEQKVIKMRQLAISQDNVKSSITKD
jgi:hypothetical protein